MDNFMEINNLEAFFSENPDSLVFAILGSRYIEQGLFDRALAVTRKGMEKHPTYAFGHYVLGLCYYHLNDVAKAKTHLQLSVAYDDKNPGAWKILTEINASLDSAKEAEESKLKYYLLDSYNEDAVEQFQKEDLFNFSEFEAGQNQTMEDDLPEDVFPIDEQDAEGRFEDEEHSIDELFEENLKQEEEIDISQKVEEVFKETLGDMSIDIERKERPLVDADEEEEEAQPEMITPEETDESRSKDPQNLTDKEIDLALEEFFSEHDQDPFKTDKKKSSPDHEETPFDEEDTYDSFAEPQEDAPTVSEEDFFDFDSVVDEFISEHQEDTEQPAAKVEPPAAMSEEESETEPDIEPSAIAETLDLPEISDMRSANDQPARRSREERASQFTRPPILSPTLGEIYIAQGRFREAIEVFAQLLDKDPSNQRFRKKIKDIQGMLDKQGI